MFSATFERLLNSARATCNTLHKQVGEDTIDHMHRLAKMGLTVEEITQVTGVPYVSVEYWFAFNGYGDEFRDNIRRLLLPDDGEMGR